MGDFNDTPFDVSINKDLDASLDSIFDTKNELFNLTADLAKKGQGTYSYKSNWFMLDNIIVSQSFLKKNNSIYATSVAKIHKDDFVSYYNPKANDTVPGKTYGGNNYYGGISDHFAVYSHFTIKK
jgi:Endonuclease/Exonuclease/phosphatase family